LRTKILIDNFQWHAVEPERSISVRLGAALSPALNEHDIYRWNRGILRINDAARQSYKCLPRQAGRKYPEQYGL
jgi:hypothetical protein